MGRIGWSEILLLLVVALILFGARRLPEIARSFGKSIQEFKKGMSNEPESDTKKSSNNNPPTPPSA